MKEKLIEIRETLNHVTVCGQQNLYFLLGAIQNLDDLIAAEDKAKEKAKVTEVTEDA